eukprot:7383606-Prymnesium_polylepis.1
MVKNGRLSMKASDFFPDQCQPTFGARPSAHEKPKKIRASCDSQTKTTRKDQLSTRTCRQRGPVRPPSV